jgi:HEPN domain-containing protein
VYLEDLCFDAQQAAEKAIKALLIKHGVPFPYVHDLARLVTLLEEAGQEVPEVVRRTEGLTLYAVVTRYPGLAEPVTEEHYQEAAAIAEAVVVWAEEQLTGQI